MGTQYPRFWEETTDTDSARSHSYPSRQFIANLKHITEENSSVIDYPSTLHTTKMAHQELASKQSSNKSSSDSGLVSKTTESVSNAAASIGGAFSGSVSAGTNASSKSTTTETHGGSQMTKEQADKLYEERMEDEYAKREGGA